MTNTDSSTGRRSRPAPLEVQVARVERRRGGFVRVTVAGESLSTFIWPGPASHLKLFPPAERPSSGETFAAAPMNGRPTSRTYTPRSFDAAHHLLDIDVLLHGDGPGADWAAHVDPGERARISVPRASYRVDPDAAWLLLAGDDSAVPAIATIIDGGVQLPTHVVMETVSSLDDRPQLPAHPLVSVTWMDAQPAAPGATLEVALRDWTAPGGRGAIWVACEALAVRRIRRLLLDEQGIAPDALVTRGYWRQGAVNHPDHDFGEDLL